MHNLLNSNKGQFFILSAFLIITMLYLISKWMQPGAIIDTSKVVVQEDFFILNNIVEKGKQTVELSDSCEELNFNLEEYKEFVLKYCAEKNIDLKFEYRQLICNETYAEVKLEVILTHLNFYGNKSLIVKKYF